MLSLLPRARVLPRVPVGSHDSREVFCAAHRNRRARLVPDEKSHKVTPLIPQAAAAQKTLPVTRNATGSHSGFRSLYGIRAVSSL